MYSNVRSISGWRTQLPKLCLFISSSVFFLSVQEHVVNTNPVAVLVVLGMKPKACYSLEVRGRCSRELQASIKSL